MRLPTTALTLLTVAVVLACDAAAVPSPSGPIRPGTSDAPREVNVILRDYLILPDPIRLVRGEVIRLNVINGGLIAHELVLGGPEVQAAWASAEAVNTPPVVAATPPPISLPPDLAGVRLYLDSGQQTSVIYRVPLTGELEVACQIPGHVEQGMVGHVEFVAPAP
ncbi:MAG: hypothetical protein ACXWPJ_04135 [Candidatus Limnocylindrales bacterium]